MVTSNQARLACMNAIGTAGRLASRVRIFEKMARELTPVTPWESNIDDQSYKLSKPVATEGSLLVFSASHKLQAVQGGYLYCVIPKCTVGTVKGYEIHFGWPDLDDAEANRYSEIDDIILPAEQALVFALIRQSVVTLMTAKMTYEEKANTGDYDRVCFLPSLPLIDGPVFESYPELADQLQQLDKLKNEMIDQGVTICHRASAVERGIDMQLIPMFRKWECIIGHLGTDRFIATCLQHYSAYRIDQGIKNQGESYLVKFSQDVHRIDFSSSEKQKQIELLALLGHLLTPYFATIQKNLVDSAEQLVAIYNHQVQKEMLSVDDKWLEGLPETEVPHPKKEVVC